MSRGPGRAMRQPDFEAARQYALNRLQRELSPLAAYHSLAHTLDEVVPAADQFAALEGVTGEDLLEQILADADLSILGQAHYLSRNAALREELAAFGLIMTDRQWYDSQLKFIRDHRYFTVSACQLCDAQKQINIAAMAALLAQSQNT